MAKRNEYIVHGIESPAGQALLSGRGLSTDDLDRALIEVQKRDRVHIGTAIGISADGFFASPRNDWHPDQPDAFAERLIFIPWVQILEYLGRMPEGTTGEFLKRGVKGH